MSTTFQSGEIVRLKSGGPKMTVERAGDDLAGRPLIWCVWFDDKNVKQNASFPPDALTKEDS